MEHDPTWADGEVSSVVMLVICYLTHASALDLVDRGASCRKSIYLGYGDHHVTWPFLSFGGTSATDLRYTQRQA